MAKPKPAKNALALGKFMPKPKGKTMKGKKC